MLSIFDEYPIHQTSETIDRPAVSDPNVYERFYFTFFEKSGAAAVGLTLTLHPNRGLVDAAFGVTTGRRYESLMMSDVLTSERENISCGPLRLEILEPMRHLRITIDGHTDFSVSIDYRATSPANREERVTRSRERRVVQVRTRYALCGSVTGSVVGPYGELVLDENNWTAVRDHSWGIWDGPKQHTTDVRPAAPSFFWLIGNVGSTAVQAVTHAEPDGTPYGEYAATCPLLSPTIDAVGPGTMQRICEVKVLGISYVPGTRYVADAQLALSGPSSEQVIVLKSLCVVHPHSIGYSHPEWRSGSIPEQLPSVRRFSGNLDDFDLSDPQHHRALQGVSIECEGRIGYGVIDQFSQ